MRCALISLQVMEPSMSVAAFEEAARDMMESLASQQLPYLRLFRSKPTGGLKKEIKPQRPLTDLFKKSVPLLHLVPLIAQSRDELLKTTFTLPKQPSPLVETERQFILMQVGNHFSPVQGPQLATGEPGPQLATEEPVSSNLSTATQALAAKGTSGNVKVLEQSKSYSEEERVRALLDFVTHTLPPVHEVVLHNRFFIKLNVAVSKPDKDYDGLVKTIIYIENPVRNLAENGLHKECMCTRLKKKYQWPC